MAFIGNSVQNQGFTPAIDYFNGNGVTVTFTLSRPIASVAQVIVAVDNVIQNPSSAFNVVGNSITFTSAPLAGTNNIWVEYTSLITTYQGISQDPTVIGDIRATGGYLAEGDFGNSFVDGNLIDYVTGRGRFTVGELDDITFYHGGTSARSAMMDLYYAGGAKIYGTTALTLPSGTTGERPASPVNGMIRYNTTISQNEIYQNGAWNGFSFVYPIEYLVVAGGGGGGRTSGSAGASGGAGAGGYRTNNGVTSYSVTSNTAYAITVGAGGAGRTGSNGQGTDGSNSAFDSITSTGGGGGSGAQSGDTAGRSGGSGSGGSGGAGGLTVTGGSGTAGQGNNGGNGAPSSGFSGGGGGGAGAAGQAASGITPGAGGAGRNTESTWASATSTGVGGFYAGGGGGADNGGGAGGAGGSGGGGAGSTSANTQGTAGTANTGGGAGASGYQSQNGVNGGSGIVIIRYQGVQRATGGTVVTTGGFTYHTFTSSGTFTA